jgi:hypothetical protein
VLVNTCCSKALLLGNNSKLSLCQQILVPYFVKSVHQCEYMYLIFSPILSGKVIINFHFQRNTFQDIPFPVFLWIAFKVLIRTNVKEFNFWRGVNGYIFKLEDFPCPFQFFLEMMIVSQWIFLWFFSGETKAFVCHNFTCSPPVSTKEDLVAIIESL